MAEDQSKDNARQFVIQRIYTKDVSYESPNAPEIFRKEWQPAHELNLGTRINKISEDTYEVILEVTVTTKIGDQTATLVEVHQAGIVSLKGFPEKEMGPLLGAYCPNLLFPYAREVVSDLVTKGSFPQLVLQPVNFDALYAQRQQQAAAEQHQATGGEPAKAH